jgi:hypothetical protein
MIVLAHVSLLDPSVYKVALGFINAVEILLHRHLRRLGIEDGQCGHVSSMLHRPWNAKSVGQ